jgi:hypothetical protein
MDSYSDSDTSPESEYGSDQGSVTGSDCDEDENLQWSIRYMGGVDIADQRAWILNSTTWGQTMGPLFY